MISPATEEIRLKKTPRQIQKQIKAVREEVADILDYLELLEARVDNQGKQRFTISEARRKLGLSSKSSAI